MATFREKAAHLAYRMFSVYQYLIVILFFPHFDFGSDCTRSRGYKTFLSSAQLSMKFQLLINVEIVKKCGKLRFKTQKLVDVIYPAHKNVKMPTNVGILTFMSRINFSLS